MAALRASTSRAVALRNRCFSLAKTCSMGFRSGEYFGKKNSLAPAELAHCLAPVTAEVVHDDDVVRVQAREQNRLDVGSEGLTVDRAIENPWGANPIVAVARY